MKDTEARQIDDALAARRWRYNPETEFYESLPTPDCGSTIVDPSNVEAVLPDYSWDVLDSYEEAKRLEWSREGKPALGGVELP